MTRKTALPFDYHCAGDVVVGDQIKFTESFFSGSYRNPKFVGTRTIEALVLRDSYGLEKQQHTFTLKVLASAGTHPLTVGKTVRRKGRNIYRNGTLRRGWDDEAARVDAQNEKHGRGDSARTDRAARVEF
jgi:hypothetical protein